MCALFNEKTTFEDFIVAIYIDERREGKQIKTINISV